MKYMIMDYFCTIISTSFFSISKAAEVVEWEEMDGQLTEGAVDLIAIKLIYYEIPIMNIKKEVQINWLRIHWCL